MNLVVPQDYLLPVVHQIPVARDDLKNDLVRNSELAATRVHRSAAFTARHPPRLVASASILLALRECQSRPVEGGAEGAGPGPAEAQLVESLSQDLQRWLSLEVAGFEPRLSHGRTF